jgi:hypothetical protein
MPNIDIEVDADLQEAFQIPTCVDLGLPNAGELKLRLPTGGTFQAFADISKGIPTDCSMTFNLMLQLAPFLAAIECPLKILKLLKPLIEIVNSLPGIPPVKAIKEFGEAAADLTESCILKIAVPELAIIPFIQDLLCLILKVLRCFRSQMKSLLAIMGPLTLQLQTAQADGNDELVATIQCAQQNAQTQATQLMNSLGPVGVLLDLAGPLFGIAGVQAIQLPALGSATDLNALRSVVKSIQSVEATIQIAADALGGCN